MIIAKYPTDKWQFHEIRCYFEKRDIWVGVFWDMKYEFSGYVMLSIFVCLLPCVPIRLRFHRLFEDSEWTS